MALAAVALIALGARPWRQAVPVWKGEMAQFLSGLEPLKVYVLRWVGDAGGTMEWCKAASANGIIVAEVPDGPATFIITDGDTAAVAEDQIRDEHTEVRVFNVKGQLVYSRRVERDEFNNWSWDGVGNDGQRVASGGYFYRYGTLRGKVVIVR